jgi:AcrR family transcriptional regulator
MAHAVAKNGYQATSVAEVIRLAGVSRTTFYAHFANKQDCFMATYEMLIYRMIKNIRRAHQSGGDWDRALSAAFQALEREVLGDPNGSRIVIVGVPDTAARPAHLARRAEALWEQTLRQSLCSSPRGADVSEVLITGILGGVRNVIATRLLEGRGRLPGTCEGLLQWVLSYHTPRANHSESESGTAKDHGSVRRRRRGAPEGGGTRAQAPAGRTRSTAAASKSQGSERRLPAIPRQPGGYGGAVSGTAADWPGAIRASLDALIEFIAAHPNVGRLRFTEVWGETNTTATRAGEPLDDFAALLGRGHEISQRPPAPIASEAVAAAIWSSIRNETLAGRAQQLHGLRNELTDLALTPFARAPHEAELSGHPRQGALLGLGGPPHASKGCYR